MKHEFKIGIIVALIVELILIIILSILSTMIEDYSFLKLGLSIITFSDLIVAIIYLLIGWITHKL